MELLLKRLFTYSQQKPYTIGHLFINGQYFCDTLEDRIRDLSIEPKIPKETAIPFGVYKVTITYSNRFKREMPLVNDVPYFSGIRIHSGNTSEDTEGCILVGENRVKGKVVNSKLTFDKLYPILKDTFDKGEEILINIV